MRTRLLLFAYLAASFLAPSIAWTASHYIRTGASGANDGSSWANAWSTLAAATWTRGDEYYVAAGTYTNDGATFGTVNSGTTLIKICKATVSTVGSCSTAHGSDTGWSDSYGSGQVAIIIPAANAAAFWFQAGKDYWVFDGVTGSGSDTSSYGIYITAVDANLARYPILQHGSNVTIKHVAITCPGSFYDQEQLGIYGIGNNATVSYAYLDNCQVNVLLTGSDVTIEHSYLGTNWSSGSHHGVAAEMNINPIFRYNTVTSCVGGQCIEPNNANMVNGQFYGNVFTSCTSGNGVIKATSSDAIVDTVIYNNTVIDCPGPILYQNNVGLGSGSGNTVINNLFYNSSAKIIEQAGGGAIAHSYNALFDYTIDTPPSETGIQIATGNPFVNLASGNYHLRISTDAGFTLASPYDVDMDGISRGTDGTWDRGALEFVGSNNPRFSPALNLRRVEAPADLWYTSGPGGHP
jgi:hypothetical protein